MLCPFCGKTILSASISNGFAFFIHGTRGLFSAGCSVEVRKLVRTTPAAAIPNAYLDAEQLGPLELLRSIGVEAEPTAGALYGCVRCGGAWSSPAERLEHECIRRLEVLPTAKAGAWREFLEFVSASPVERRRSLVPVPGCPCPECMGARAK